MSCAIGRTLRLRHAGPMVSACQLRRSTGVFGSFGFGWFGILLLRLNLLKDVPARCAGKSFRRLVGHVDLGQGECPVLNLEDGEDHLADAIRWWRTFFDGGV